MTGKWWALALATPVAAFVGPGSPALVLRGSARDVSARRPLAMNANNLEKIVVCTVRRRSTSRRHTHTISGRQAEDGEVAVF